MEKTFVKLIDSGDDPIIVRVDEIASIEMFPNDNNSDSPLVGTIIYKSGESSYLSEGSYDRLVNYLGQQTFDLSSNNYQEGDWK